MLLHRVAPGIIYFFPEAKAEPVNIAPNARWNRPPPINVKGLCCPVSFFISSICTIGSGVLLMISMNKLMSGRLTPYHMGTNIKS